MLDDRGAVAWNVCPHNHALTSSWTPSFLLVFWHDSFPSVLIASQIQAGDDSYKCLHGLAPTCLADNCLAISAIAGKWHLRSVSTGTLSVPRTRNTLGIRSFAVAGPVIWNSLPAALWSATLSPLTFTRDLKAHLFGWLTAHLRTIYDALGKSTHYHHHQVHTQLVVPVLHPIM